METIDLNWVDVINNVERFEFKMEILLEEYFKLHAKIKGVFGEQHPSVFRKIR